MGFVRSCANSIPTEVSRLNPQTTINEVAAGTRRGEDDVIVLDGLSHFQAFSA
jgi:hypothetical protein